MKPTAEYSLPASFTPQKREELFEEIVRLYDLEDSVLASVASDNATHRNEQMAIVNPFITQVTNSTNILVGFYTEVVRNGRPITPDLQETFEKAFENIFDAYKDFLNGLKTKFSS